jgi:serine/threonine-protein kinase
MSVGIGDKLGVHEITSLLGKGGMGEVYRARDGRLKRDVAIKILPPEFARDPDRLLRFRREAEVLASLNHPNIGAIYDFHEAGDTQFLVMELVEGETLADRLHRGPLPVEDALRIAVDICDALDAAHEKGIIHRDLKPANITIARDGRVKVLDFGLAKAMEPARAGGTMANSPTLSLTATQAGIILGTAAYMSPEQAKGFDVDRRSDLFSFGCVLYEMLTGRQPFQGDTVPEVLASVLVREPDLNALSPTLNPRLVELVQRCLHKNPKRRWQAAGDVREELEIISKNPRAATLPQAATVAPQPLWRRAAPVVLAAIVCGALAATAAWMLKPSPAPPVARFAVLLPEGQNFSRTRSHVSAISHDGSMIVYAANRQLYLRRLGEPDAQPIPGTSEDVGSPFFSPDDGWIGFFSFGDTAIKKIPIGGGTAVPVCSGCTNTLGYGVSWSANTIVFVRSGQAILKVPDTGGTPQAWVTAAPGELLSSPQVLPGNRLMFSVMKSGTDWSKADIVVQNESGERKVAIRGGSGARYLPSGHIVYSVGPTLYVIAFDMDRVVPTGDPVAVAQGLLLSLINYGNANFDVSETGTLVYASGNAYEADRFSVLATADRAGSVRAVPGLQPANYRTPRVSPDGTQVAMEVVDDASISVYDLSGRSQLRRLTLEGTNQAPVWSPDGKRIAFRSVRAGHTGLFVQNADGSGPAEQLYTFDPGLSPMAWSDDDRIVFVQERRLWLFSLKDRRAELMPEQPGDAGSSQFNLSLSRRSDWAAFVSAEGRPAGNRVFLRQFPGGTKYLVSRELANAPVWSRDGLELFYFQSDSRSLVSVRVTPPPAFSLTEPAVIPIKTVSQAEGDFRQFDVMPDGKFLILQPAPQEDGREATATQQINVVLNWGDELERIAPRRR